MPRRHRKDHARHRGAGRRGYGDDHGVQGQSAPQHLTRIDEARKGNVHPHYGGRAQALHGARGQNHGETAREGAQGRGTGKHGHADQESAPVTVKVACRRQRQQEHCDDKLVDRDDPHGARGRHAEFAGQHRQGHIYHRHVKHGHHQHDKDGGHGRVAAYVEVWCHHLRGGSYQKGMSKRAVAGILLKPHTINLS